MTLKQEIKDALVGLGFKGSTGNVKAVVCERDDWCGLLDLVAVTARGAKPKTTFLERVPGVLRERINTAIEIADARAGLELHPARDP